MTLIPSIISSTLPTTSTFISTIIPTIITNYSNIINETLITTPTMPSTPLQNGPSPTQSSSIYSLRMALTITHLLLVSIGSINLLVIFVILSKSYMRSITNVYMISLCLADFMYLANLTLVAATQLNDRSWIFGFTMCTIYHGTETTGKYASVLFVVLLAADRYCAMCKANLCSRYRTYRCAIVLSLIAWFLSILAATPLYAFSEVVMLRYRFVDKVQKLCIAKWPSSEAAKWYITFSSVLIFALPLILIVFCYYHILNKLREALKGSKRMRRAASSRAPYQRVTRLVLWVVIFHVICWSPFWLFNVFSSVFGLRIQTQFDRIVINFLHLLPYFNCALNPLLYATHAENFRQAIKSIFTCNNKRQNNDTEDSRVFGKASIKPQKSTYNRLSCQSSDRLLSSTQLLTNHDFLTDPTIRFKKSSALSDIIPSNKININLTINDSTSMCTLNDKSSLLLLNKTTSKSYDNITNNHTNNNNSNNNNFNSINNNNKNILTDYILNFNSIYSNKLKMINNYQRNDNNNDNKLNNVIIVNENDITTNNNINTSNNKSPIFKLNDEILLNNDYSNNTTNSIIQPKIIVPLQQNFTNSEDVFI